MFHGHHFLFNIHFILVVILNIDQIKSCPAQCFCQLGTVDCSYLDLLNVPSGVPKTVRELNLEGNSLTSLRRSDFRSYKSLQNLILRKNELQYLKNNTFYSLKKLKKLDLSDNDLGIIETKTFSRMPQLSTLSLSNNNIESIDGIITNLKSLVKLDLSNNHIAEIGSAALVNLPSLRYLDLYNNNISVVSSHSFQALNIMSYLDIKNNPLGNIDGVFEFNHLLSYIELSNCGLEKFPLGLSKGIRYLQMGKNNITTIYASHLSGYANLQILVLDNNNIQQIESGSFLPLKHLSELWLNNNNITAIPEIPENVKKLHLGRNRITSINFQTSMSIEELYIQGNKIRVISATDFNYLPNLQELDIGGNEIKVFSKGVFSSLPLLKTLKLDMNDFHTMETGVFEGVTALEHLSMSMILTQEASVQGNIFQNLTLKRLDVQESPAIANKIVNSQQILASLVTVEELNLMDNNIATLTVEFKRSLPRLVNLQIKGNPFHCDTRMLWFKKWLEQGQDEDLFYMLDYIECYSPTELYGRRVIDLLDEEFISTTLPPIYLSTQFTTPKIKGIKVKYLNSTVKIPTSDLNNSHNPTNLHGKAEKRDRTNFITIAASVSTVIIIVIIMMGAYFIYRRRKWLNFQSNFCRNHTNGLSVPPPPPVRMTRSDRSSVTSQTGEDINNGVSKMKVYTWDN